MYRPTDIEYMYIFIDPDSQTLYILYICIYHSSQYIYLYIHIHISNMYILYIYYIIIYIYNTHIGQIPMVKTKVWDEEQGTLNGEGIYVYT